MTRDDLVKRIESKISGLDHELEADLVKLLADAADRIEALEKALRDAQSGLRYIQQRYGALEGVGWDRVLPPKETTDDR